jgi:hypothetical protein
MEKNIYGYERVDSSNVTRLRGIKASGSLVGNYNGNMDTVGEGKKKIWNRQKKSEKF